MKLRLCLLISASLQACAQQGQPLPSVIEPNAYELGRVTPASQEAMLDVINQLEQLQQEVRTLRGSFEEQNFRIRKLEQRQTQLYQDLDHRLDAQQPASGAVDTPLPEVMPTPDDTPPPSTTTPPAVIADQGQAKDTYRHAYETLKQGLYSEAIVEFEAFLNNYPTNDYSDNAQYWIGEAYLVLNDHASAQAAFVAVAKRYPDSDKVRDALLKLGYIALDQGDRNKAKVLFEQIVQHYPNTTAAHLAEKKLLKL
ncbi:MAG: tol-pal system protein YbgF [Methylococcales bacterium]|nr:tol-pal system protein YbgF [Methylococcales bacterium]